MTTRIYYFSATGNCLAVARQIADDIGADIVSIARLDPTERILLEHKRIGLVFPAYLSPVLGVPLIVERFIRRLDGLQTAEIFSVCTCGGYEVANALAPLEKMRKLIRACGGTLFAEYSVRLPMNNLDYEHIPIPICSDIPKIIDNARRKTAQISNHILHGKGTRFALPKLIAGRLIAAIYRIFRNMVMKVLREKAKEHTDDLHSAEYYLPLTDRSILVRESCINCGICAKVCPARNIVCPDGKPEFLHHCEACFACDEWCPCGAIQHWSRRDGVKYHYPTIQLSDLL
jgi:ferredoxin/flavodoxin